jgi:hypothetical protein
VLADQWIDVFVYYTTELHNQILYGSVGYCGCQKLATHDCPLLALHTFLNFESILKQIFIYPTIF